MEEKPVHAEVRPQIDKLLTALVAAKGSDLHMASSRAPVLRIHGEMKRITQYIEPTPDQLTGILHEIMTEEMKESWHKMKDADFAYHVHGVGRFRVNVFQALTGPAAVFRVIPDTIPTAAELGLPMALREMASHHKGLVLVTGATGSGKSTTLAAIIDLINSSRAAHILTIEDPIEFVHTPQKCHINQREIGTHAVSFQRALRAALREDPDIILVGELRDPETMELATTAAETGHLVFGTLHTSSAHKTVDRIISTFDGDKQSQIRSQLAETLKAVVSQQLIRKIDGKGRVAAFEILLVTPAVASNIRDNKTAQIPNTIHTSMGMGMQSMEKALADLVKAGKISQEAGLDRAGDRDLFKRMLVERSASEFD